MFDNGSKTVINAKHAEEKQEKLYQKIGRLNVEIDWLKKRWASVNPKIEIKKASIEPDRKQISKRRQCQLVGLSWSTYHFKPEKGQKWERNNTLNDALKRQMDELQL